MPLTTKVINEMFAPPASCWAITFTLLALRTLKMPSMFKEIFDDLIAKSLPGVAFHVMLGNHDYRTPRLSIPRSTNSGLCPASTTEETL
jgi:hypothetical protein